jgi:hypothetical protein
LSVRLYKELTKTLNKFIISCLAVRPNENKWKSIFTEIKAAEIFRVVDPE